VPGQRREIDVNEQALRKAAIFLMALGPNVAGKVMSKLPENLVEELAHVIASVGHVTFEEKKKILGDFVRVSTQLSGIAFGGEEKAKQILEAGFGTRKANSLLGRVTSYSEIKSFEHLRSLDALTVANYLKNEHPQTVAVVLAHMDPRDSGPILPRHLDSGGARGQHGHHVVGGGVAVHGDAVEGRIDGRGQRLLRDRVGQGRIDRCRRLCADADPGANRPVRRRRLPTFGPAERGRQHRKSAGDRAVVDPGAHRPRCRWQRQLRSEQGGGLDRVALRAAQSA